jgi:hypothetical protein
MANLCKIIRNSDSINLNNVKETKRKLKHSASTRFRGLFLTPEDGGITSVRIIIELMPGNQHHIPKDSQQPDVPRLKKTY